MSEAKRVVFDLDETLINIDYFPEELLTLRPGAEELLDSLLAGGLELILWTTATKAHVDKVFNQFPGLRQNFSQVITREDSPKLLEPLRDEAGRFDRDDPRRWKFNTLSQGGAGGKYPPAISAQYLVDDAEVTAHTAGILKTFERISPNSLESDTVPDEWAKRVAQALLGE